MQHEREIVEPPGRHLRQRLERDRHGVGRAVGGQPGPFEPRHVAQIGHGRGRREAVEERAEGRAVAEQERRARRILGRVAARGAAEERPAGELAHRRIGGFERFDQPGHEVVAVDVEAPARREPFHRAQDRGCRGLGVAHGAREGGLDASKVSRRHG
jgi:hypothetical protein